MWERLAVTLAQLAQPTYLWIAFGIELVLFGVLSAVLVYHWASYTIDKKKVRRIMRTYFTGAGLLVLVKAIALFLYSLS